MSPWAALVLVVELVFGGGSQKGSGFIVVTPSESGLTPSPSRVFILDPSDKLGHYIGSHHSEPASVFPPVRTAWREVCSLPDFQAFATLVNHGSDQFIAGGHAISTHSGGRLPLDGIDESRIKFDVQRGASAHINDVDEANSGLPTHREAIKHDAANPQDWTMSSQKLATSKLPKFVRAVPEHKREERNKRPAVIIYEVENAQESENNEIIIGAVVWGAILALAAYIGRSNPMGILRYKKKRGY